MLKRVFKDTRFALIGIVLAFVSFAVAFLVYMSIEFWVSLGDIPNNYGPIYIVWSSIVPFLIWLLYAVFRKRRHQLTIAMTACVSTLALSLWVQLSMFPTPSYADVASSIHKQRVLNLPSEGQLVYSWVITSIDSENDYAVLQYSPRQFQALERQVSNAKGWKHQNLNPREIMTSLIVHHCDSTTLAHTQVLPSSGVVQAFEYSSYHRRYGTGDYYGVYTVTILDPRTHRLYYYHADEQWG